MTAKRSRNVRNTNQSGLRKAGSTANQKAGRNSYTSWEPLADWYDGWMGKDGGKHHRMLALPALLDLLEVQPGEKVLDVGAGQGVLAPHIARAHACYTGVDASQSIRHLKESPCLPFTLRAARRPNTFDIVVLTASGWIAVAVSVRVSVAGSDLTRTPRRTAMSTQQRWSTPLLATVPVRRQTLV